MILASTRLYIPAVPHGATAIAGALSCDSQVRSLSIKMACSLVLSLRLARSRCATSTVTRAKRCLLSRPAEPGGLVRRLTGMWLIHRINRLPPAASDTVPGCAPDRSVTGQKQWQKHPRKPAGPTSMTIRRPVFGPLERPAQLKPAPPGRDAVTGQGLHARAAGPFRQHGDARPDPGTRRPDGRLRGGGPGRPCPERPGGG